MSEQNQQYVNVEVAGFLRQPPPRSFKRVVQFFSEKFRCLSENRGVVSGSEAAAFFFFGPSKKIMGRLLHGAK